MIPNCSYISMRDLLNHLVSIWYHPEPSNVSYSPKQLFALDFFCRFFQQDSSKVLNKGILSLLWNSKWGNFWLLYFCFFYSLSGFLFRRLASYALSICAWVEKIKFDELDFLVYFKLNFYCALTCKNQFQNLFFKLDFSNLSFNLNFICHILGCPWGIMVKVS
jgi:hypothetical protein